jgi:predicted GNAT family N-acyltransferase
VYKALGYLESRIANLAVEMELDTYDTHSLHLCAVERPSGQLAGTLRLVLPADRRRTPAYSRGIPTELKFDALRSLADVIRAQRFWIRQIADGEPVLSNKLHEENPLIPFPIMDSTDFGELWPEFLQHYDYQETGEISRVIAAPQCRGLGVSALLMRAAIAAASELQLRHLLLECIPTHVGMYQKYGFEPLPRRHCRARELDQFALGMRLELDAEAHPSEAMVRLQRDLRMLRLGLNSKTVLLGSRGLCLCRRLECWKGAEYAGWGARYCPLVKDMALI